MASGLMVRPTRLPVSIGSDVRVDNENAQHFVGGFELPKASVQTAESAVTTIASTSLLSLW